MNSFLTKFTSVINITNDNSLLILYELNFSDGENHKNEILIKYMNEANFKFDVEIINNLFKIFLAQLFLYRGNITLVANEKELKIYEVILRNLYLIRNYEESVLENINIPNLICTETLHSHINNKVEKKLVLNLISGGKDSLASDILLRNNDISVINCFIDGLNIKSNSEEHTACKKIYNNFCLISVKGFDELINIAIKHISSLGRPPVYNYIPRGRDLLSIAFSIPYAISNHCEYITHSCEKDLWCANINSNYGVIPMHDSQSYLVIKEINFLLKKLIEIGVFSPIAGLSEYYILSALIKNHKYKLKQIQSCFYGEWCGRCKKCMRYYLIQKSLCDTTFKFKSNPEKFLNSLKENVEKSITDNEYFSYQKEISYLLGLCKLDDTLLSLDYDELYPDYYTRWEL